MVTLDSICLCVLQCELVQCNAPRYNEILFTFLTKVVNWKQALSTVNKTRALNNSRPSPCIYKRSRRHRLFGPSDISGLAEHTLVMANLPPGSYPLVLRHGLPPNVEPQKLGGSRRIIRQHFDFLVEKTRRRRHLIRLPLRFNSSSVPSS